MKDPITLVIADDHPLFRAGVRQVIEADASLLIVGEAADGERALAVIKEKQPRTAVLDIQMPNMTGLVVAETLLSQNSSTSVILLTMFDDQKMFFQAMDIGVKGYVLKDAALQEIIHAIHAVADERYYLSPALSGLLITRRSPLAAPTTEGSPVEMLTPSERQIVSLIAELKSNKEIADTLFISNRTVENH
ncbi:MAG: response regulator transcription factor, partial [Bacteroidota bacterium]